MAADPLLWLVAGAAWSGAAVLGAMWIARWPR